jgi:hypothetical protein
MSDKRVVPVEPDFVLQIRPDGQPYELSKTEKRVLDNALMKSVEIVAEQPQESAPIRHAVTCRKFPDPYDERESKGPCDCGAEQPQGTEWDWTEDFSHENGNYENVCIRCTVHFKGHKRRVVCKKCSTDTSTGMPQESAPDYDALVKRFHQQGWIYADCLEVIRAIEQLAREVSRKDAEITAGKILRDGIRKQCDAAERRIEEQNKTLGAAEQRIHKQAAKINEAAAAIEELSAKLAEAERDALERAAKVCEYEESIWAGGARKDFRLCAAAIRSLAASGKEK